ncbi:uncharacterized protein (DUF362 family) [Hydrogenispora ethanolica]|jgi:uncharacterized protein (DUF362 family)|uniref:Uncharacterized protein (DUF362 family) n=1 Tax=Hydrogenispora ethanolica TaxID=1082276 RepID=A0A4V6NGU1_HYDET|nr:DUF362 domain-containing protein [Hydrogenispora ethanolica]TCL63757.1 uncharacterized protein (DUF362 family) [Hydrogenispora ethanolica]
MKPEQITVIYGTDPYSMTERLLERIALADLIPAGARIALKPNLVVAKPADSGATTHPAIAEAIIVYLQAHGFKEISIMEGSWLGETTEHAFQICGYTELARKYRVPLIDLKQAPTVRRRGGELDLAVCRPALESDYLINLPVLKAHCQTELTCALKNLKGCIPDAEKRRYHNLGLHRPIAALSSVLRPGLTIVDALSGDLSFEEGGNPVPMDRIIAGTDPVLLDAYAATLIGLESGDIPYIGFAAGLGVGSAELGRAAVIEINPDEKPSKPFRLTGQARNLAQWIEERQACSACYGSLIHALYRLKERGVLRKLPGPVRIGQGFRGVSGPGPGIGSCTRSLQTHLPGCPPTAAAIIRFLKAL